MFGCSEIRLRRRYRAIHRFSFYIRRGSGQFVHKLKTMKKELLVLFAVIAGSASLMAQDYRQRMDSLVAKYFDEAEFTGVVLVAKGDKVLLKRGYGYSDAEQKILNDTATVFNVASLTKTFTAAVILKLQEAGRLSVLDLLSKYYPGFPNAEKIRIHHLLNHTSGLFNYTNDQRFQALDQTKELTLEEMIAWFKDKPLDFEPGTKFNYSNSGYTMLGYIIEKVTGTTYAKALESYIFKPLGMDHSSFGPPEPRNVNLAKGYMMYYKNFKYPCFSVHPSISYATGAVYSTVEDLYKWHRALQNGKFLSKASLEVAYKKDRGNYGYGWFTDSLYGRPRVSHDGNISGYKSNINRFPEENLCVIALSNANNSLVGGMVRNLVNIAYDQPFSKSFADQPVLQLPDSLKKEYTGIYKFKKEDSEVVSVLLQDTDLYIAVPGKAAVKILPVNKNAFKSGTIRIEFMRDKQGKIEQMMVFDNGEIMGVQKMSNL
jgi:CubicO group peptidase (beta-lactamase class C family)